LSQHLDAIAEILLSAFKLFTKKRPRKVGPSLGRKLNAMIPI